MKQAKNKEKETSVKVATLDRVSFKKDLSKLLKTRKAQKQFDEDMTVLRLSADLAAERNHRHLSQGQLAKLADMKQQDISRFEKGGHNITVKNLLKIADALDVHIEVSHK